MRKIFTLLMTVALCNGMWAQDVKITNLWDHSVNGTADWSMGFPVGGAVPTWMGNLTERGMAHFDGKLYIPSRSSNSIVVLDALTGNMIKEIALGEAIGGGTYPFNDISITENGDIVLCNLTTSSIKSPFKVYVLSDDGSGNYATVTTLIEWTSPAGTEEVPEPDYRIGDGFGVYGDVLTGDGYVIAAHNGLPGRVFRWNVNGGALTAEPVIFDVKDVLPAVDLGTDPKIGLSPKFWPVNNDLVWIDGHSIMPGLYDMSGNLVSTFSAEAVLPKTSGISGVSYFTFKSRDFMWAPTTNHVTEPKAAFEAFEIPTTGLADAVSLGVYPENGMGANSNASYAAPVAIDVQLDKVLLFAMSPNNGIAAYELSISGSTAVGDEVAVKKSVLNNPAVGVIRFASELAEVCLYDLSGRLVKSLSNVNQMSVDGLKGLYVVSGVKLNGETVKEKVLIK